MNNLEDFITHLTHTNRVSPHTVSAFKRDISDYLKYGKEKLNLATVSKYMTHLSKKNFESSTINRKLVSLRSFFRWCKAERIIKTNEIADLKGPKIGKKLPVFLTSEEIKLLLNFEGDDFLSVRDKAILEVLYGCGLRVQEVVDLLISNLEESSVFLINGKNNKQRRVPIPEQTYEAMKPWLKMRRPNVKALFTDHFGAKLNRSKLFWIVTSRARLAGIKKKVTPHVLRHSYATHLMNKGAGIREIQSLLGHSSIASTQIYTHVSNEQLTETIKKYHARA